MVNGFGYKVLYEFDVMMMVMVVVMDFSMWVLGICDMRYI